MQHPAGPAGPRRLLRVCVTVDLLCTVRACAMRALYLPSEAQLVRVAQLLANQLARDRAMQPFVVALRGPVGVGKSVFARGLLRRWMRDPKLIVPSPTFGIMQTYNYGRALVNHVDLYRLSSTAELDVLGLDVLRAKNSSFIVEWPALLVERFPDWPRVDVELTLEPPTTTSGGDDVRRAQLTATWDAGKQMLTRLDGALCSQAD